MCACDPSCATIDASLNESSFSRNARIPCAGPGTSSGFGSCGAGWTAFCGSAFSIGFCCAICGGGGTGACTGFGRGMSCIIIVITRSGTSAGSSVSGSGSSMKGTITASARLASSAPASDLRKRRSSSPSSVHEGIAAKFAQRVDLALDDPFVLEAFLFLQRVEHVVFEELRVFLLAGLFRRAVRGVALRFRRRDR